MAEEQIVVGTPLLKSSFTQRHLKFEIIGGLDQKGKRIILNAQGNNALSIEGFRSSVAIQMSGGGTLSEMTAEIYNLPTELTNILSTLGVYNLTAGSYCNQVIVYASMNNSEEDRPFYTKVFEGSIIQAYVDNNGAPDCIFHLQCQQLGGFNLRGCPSVSFEGSVSKVNVVRAIVNNFKLTLNANNVAINIAGNGEKDKLNPPIRQVINCGVSGSLNNPHYHGDLKTQLDRVSQDGGFQYIAQQNGNLYIYPKGKNIDPQDVELSPPLFAPQTGMIGYPQYCSQGLIIRSLFRPELLFGQSICVRSDIKPACGIWDFMISMQHHLSCLQPNGPWETQLVMAKQYIPGAIHNDP